MKRLIRTAAIHALSLFLVSQILPGIKLAGGFPTILASAIILTILYSVVRPVINLVLLPFHILTLGSFSFLINVIILYLLTVAVPQVSVSSFAFQGISLAGFVIPKAEFNSFFAFVVVSLTFSFFFSFINWLIK